MIKNKLLTAHSIFSILNFELSSLSYYAINNLSKVLLTKMFNVSDCKSLAYIYTGAKGFLLS